MFGQYKKIRNAFTGVLTGKGTNWGGSLIRPEATGYGLVYFVLEMLQTRKDSLKGKTVTVSGSGNVAQFACEKLIELGAKPVTLSDSSGFIHDPDGITQEKIEYVKKLKSVRSARISEYAKKFNVEYVEGKSPWSIKCDIALPCATENELNLDLETYKSSYQLSSEKLESAKGDVIVMHPGPVNYIEITEAVYDSENSVIRQQIANGVAVRMAVLSRFLGS